MKKESTVSFDEGSLIFAKVKGYPAWPSRVTKQLDANRFEVLYFGTYRTAKLNKANMIPYNEESKIKFKSELEGDRAVDPLLEQALYEIANNPGISEKGTEPILTFPNFQPSKRWMTELQTSMIL